MNYKLEKFWNNVVEETPNTPLEWTINLKSFEIIVKLRRLKMVLQWTINLKSFEIIDLM